MGTAIRIAIIVAWLALIGQQIVHHALPGLGLVERRDVAAAVGAQLDRTLTYEIRQRAAPGAAEDGRRVGSARMTFQRDEGYFRLDTRLELELLPLAGGGVAATLAPGLGSMLAAMRPVLRVQASQRLDDRLRLVAVEAEGDLGGIHGAVAGTVDHRGLTGTWRLRGDSGVFALPEVGRDGNQSLDFALTLPPNLQPGERWRSSVLDVDTASLTPRSAVAVFTAEARETIATRAGPTELVRVRMEADGRPRATYWCDARGTVYRGEFAGYAVVFALERVQELPATTLWPPAEATAP